LIPSSATYSARRTERRYSVTAHARSRILGFLQTSAAAVRHGKDASSNIVSLYYECAKIRADNNASIRQRTYLAAGLDGLFEQPCIVDAKVETSSTSQVKWRRSFGSWHEAQQQLCAPPRLRPVDFFPELVRHYGGIGQLSSEYGVRYRRLYFSLPGEISVTLDTDVSVLSSKLDNGSLSVISDLPDWVLEIKGATFDLHLAELTALLTLLHSLDLQSTPVSKRAQARAIVERAAGSRGP
jgi:hypothetical protein